STLRADEQYDKIHYLNILIGEEKRNKELYQINGYHLLLNYSKHMQHMEAMAEKEAENKRERM
ncbi:unnamed protein product, partial [Adineta steineri]